MGIYSIGHSTLSEAGFLELLASVPIHTVIDVRSHPSSKWPQFCIERLKMWLPYHGFAYEWWPELGGWAARHRVFQKQFLEYGIDITPYLKGYFPKQHIAMKLPEESSPSWTNAGFLFYSYFMMLPEFLDAADKLIKRNEASRNMENVALVCAEAWWPRCHRSMICDYLWFKGVDSYHVQPKLVKHSEVIGNRLERYRPEIIAAWNRPCSTSKSNQ